jgi:hypothetical protein
MRRAVTMMMVMAMLAGSATPAWADKDVTGFWLIVGGTVMVVAAFNYDASCPTGYRRHTFEGYKTLCSTVSRYGSDVRDEDAHIEYARPALLWTGVAAATAGVVLMALPKRVRKVAPSVAVTPTGWSATKTVKF